VVQASGPGLIVRVLWFIFVGWWVGAGVAAIAWVLVLTIIGLPFGLWIINRLPSIITLRPQESTYVVTPYGLVTNVRQRSFVVRAIWFLAIGWWLSGAWMALAYACVVTIVLIPVAFWMYGRVGAVTTLYRS
jgi:uncharacterized membrane protein YccF (DUF307 family)